MKKLTLALVVFLAVAAGLFAAVNRFSAPPTILHVVVVKWNADATPQQQQAAIEGLKTMAAEVPGLKNIWIKKLKIQPVDYSTSFALEFDSKTAFDAYTNSAAHKAWEKLYLPYREESQTQDITN